MNTDEYLELFDELDDNEETDNFINKDKRRKRFPERHFKYVREANADFLNPQDDSRRNFNFTYSAARFEEGWLLDSIGDFYEHRWITDVLMRLKGGKEASVYLSRSGPAIEAPLVAAKVYRPRSLRNLKNDGQYRVGRTDLDADGNVIVKDGDLHAMRKRTAYGEELRHQSWIAYEFQTLETLYAAGADVPRPYAMEKNAILMDYIGDLEMAAATLNTVTLEPDEVTPLFDRVVHNIDLLLSHQRIHGDLSAYNILYWEGDITLIDFPQVVQPEANPAAWTIFLRDVMRICQYFASQGLRRDARKLAAELWTSHGHRVTKEVHPRDLDPEKKEDRRIWESQNVRQ
ncbi:MAG TPA: RIO1 family regulatory kinase/ATPase [Anaerolineales bacterium]|nr:RIO1 family regulatory kinase/ATPase [Anaerolineales bacterium]